MPSQTGLYKLVLGLARRSSVVLMVLVSTMVLVIGCTTGPETSPPDNVDSMSPPQVLHSAAVEVFRERDLGVALESARFLLVNSEFKRVSEDLRRRYTARVIRGPEGAMGLKVTAEYQRRLVLDGETQWESIDNEQLRRRARPTELELGRAIERKFERWSQQ